MATMNTTSNNLWELPISVAASGDITKTLNTAGTFLDRNIGIKVSTPGATPSFDGGALNNKGASATFTNITTSTTNNGISVLAKGTAGRDAVLYNGAVNGYVTIADNTTASAAVASSTWNGTTYYITGITVPKDKRFSVTTTADTALDTTSNLTITNNAYRQIAITNNANGDINVTNAGQVDITQNAMSGGVTVNAYDNASNATQTGPQIIVKAGKWKYNTVTPPVSGNATTYYGATIVNPMSSGTSAEATVIASKEASAPTIARITTPISGATNVANGNATTEKPNSGCFVSIQATAPATTLTVTRTIDTAGYLGANTQINASASTTAKTGSIYYVPVASSSISKGTTSVSGKTATRGVASWNAGWINAGQISAATFANQATASTSYVDISNTTAAPILTSDGYLYINAGYTDNLRISLAQLIPDDANITASDQLLNGIAAYDSNGKLFTGTIPTKTNSDLTVSGKTVTIPAGYYATEVSKSIADGAYSADSSTSSNSTVTPSVAINNASTYGFTKTQPSGTNGTNYLTIDPGATATAWSVTPRANITTAGYLQTGNKTGTAVSNTPSIAAGTNYYVPIVAPSFEGGAVSGSSSTSITVTGMSTTEAETSYYIDAASTGSASRAAVTYSNAAGAIAKHTNTTALSASTAVDINSNASRIYIPAAGISYSGGGLSNTTNYTGTPTITLATNSSTNMANYLLGAQNTTDYPYYFQIKATTAKMTGSTKVTRAAYADTRTAGYLPARASTTVLASATSSPSVTVNAATNTNYYFSMKKATMTVAGTNTVTPSASVTGSQATLVTTNNSGISITATGGGTASVKATAKTNVAGYAPANTELGTATLNATKKTTTEEKFLKEVTLAAPSSGTREFGIKVPNGSTSEYITFVFHVDSSGNVTIDNEYSLTY